MYQIEVTDTFGGEANYCWIKRGTTRAKTRRGLIEAAKKLAGWDGWCRGKSCGKKQNHTNGDSHVATI